MSRSDLPPEWRVPFLIDDIACFLFGLIVSAAIPFMLVSYAMGWRY